MSVAILGDDHFGRILHLLKPWADQPKLNMVIGDATEGWKGFARVGGTWRTDACRAWSDLNAAAFEAEYGERAKRLSVGAIRESCAAFERARSQLGDEDVCTAERARAFHLYKMLGRVEYNMPPFAETGVWGELLDTLRRRLADFIVTTSTEYERAPWFI